MKQITLITDAWHPQTNGVVTTITKTIESLSNKGYEVNVVAPDQFFTIPMPGYEEIHLSLFPSWQMEKILKKKSDAIHIATEGPLGYSARTICKNRGMPFTTAFHTKIPEYVNARFGFISIDEGYKLLKKFHKRSKSVMVPTKTVLKELDKRGFSNLKLWSRGVDTILFDSNLRKPLPCPGPILLYVGRLSHEKGIDDFLSLKLPGTKIVIGDGPYRQFLESKYKDAVFVGYKYGKELAEYYASADVFVFPSKTDTFGLVQLESLACGTPVAAYPVAGPKDIIINTVGCLDNNLEKSIIGALKINRTKCREYALQYSWDKCADKFLEYLYWL